MGAGIMAGRGRIGCFANIYRCHFYLAGALTVSNSRAGAQGPHRKGTFMNNLVRSSSWILGLCLLCLVAVSPAIASRQASTGDQSSSDTTTKKKKSKKAASADQSASTSD